MCQGIFASNINITSSTSKKETKGYSPQPPQPPPLSSSSTSFLFVASSPIDNNIRSSINFVPNQTLPFSHFPQKVLSPFPPSPQMSSANKRMLSVNKLRRLQYWPSKPSYPSLMGILCARHDALTIIKPR